MITYVCDDELKGERVKMQNKQKRAPAGINYLKNREERMLKKVFFHLIFYEFFPIKKILSPPVVVDPDAPGLSTLTMTGGA